MSTRIGMADGRCITEFTSPRILNDTIMMTKGINFQDNYAYRMYLQSKGPEGLTLPLKNAACSNPKMYSPLVEKQ